MTEQTVAPNRDGIVYCATRQMAYAQPAADSARSLRALSCDLPITLFTDRDPLPPNVASAFTQVVTRDSPTRTPSPDWANGLIDKIEAIKDSPYERTLFIDADTIVRDAAVIHVLDRLDDVDILITECAEDASRSRQMMGRAIYSSGILAYRRTAATQSLLDHWLELALSYLDVVKAGGGAESLGLGPLSDRDACFLALTDQFSLAQIMAPDRCPRDLRVETLSEEWNFRGDGVRRPSSPIIIDHQETLRRSVTQMEADTRTVAATQPHDRLIAAFPTPILLCTLGESDLNRVLASTVREMTATQKSDDAFRSH